MPEEQTWLRMTSSKWNKCNKSSIISTTQCSETVVEKNKTCLSIGYDIGYTGYIFLNMFDAS